MRTIKFRAWHKLEGRMHREFQWVTSGSRPAHSIIFRSNHIPCARELPDFLSAIDIMQYTGLNDKNGTEIYEGDILHDGEICEPVTFEDGIFDLHLGPIESQHVYVESAVILGNQFENPELLTNQENNNANSNKNN